MTLKAVDNLLWKRTMYVVEYTYMHVLSHCLTRNAV